MNKKKKKNILILGSNEIFSLEKMYFRSFKSIGYRTYLFHIYNIRKNLLGKFFWKIFKFVYFFFIRRKIYNFIKNNNYDLIIFFKGLYINEDFILKIKKMQKNCKLANIFPDDPFNTNYFMDISNKNVLKTIKHFDFFFIWSQTISKKLKKFINKNKICYLPFGYDQFIHTKNKFKIKKTYDVSFVGTADQKRFNIISKLSKYKIIIGGDGWKSYNLPKNIKYVGNVGPKKFAKIISISKISLNILRDQNVNSHNMKTFEITAMGGLMLTQRTKEQNFFFKENKACLMYKNDKELNDKISMVLKNPKKFYKIIKKAQALSKNYAYKERAKLILNIIF